MLRHVCVHMCAHVRVSDHACETRLAGPMPVPPEQVGSKLVVCTLPGGSGARCQAGSFASGAVSSS